MFARNLSNMLKFYKEKVSKQLKKISKMKGTSETAKLNLEQF